MTSLLQRLAARATGSAWTVRSDARLPFANAPGIVETQAVEPLRPVIVPHPAQAGEGRVAMSPQHVAPTTTKPAHGAWPLAAHAQQQAAAAQAPPAPIAPWSEQTPVTATWIDVASAKSPGLDDVALTNGLDPTPTAMRHVPLTRSQSPAAQADPAPLLPVVGEARNAPAAPHARTATTNPGIPLPAFTPLRQPSPAPAEPAEVHVHIGRIEVTAITQPQAPKRAARERTQPLSLDAYLARRKDPS
ncbi:MAG: hypothetical protein QM740_18330 [Acidovorax sp.]